MLEKTIKVPETAVITVTKNCGTCDFVSKGTGGKKLACGHPRIQAKRPYIDSYKGENTRAVEADSIPDWCFLRTTDPTNQG